MTGTPIHNLSFEEVDWINEWMANLFRSFGIEGDELDHAIAGSFGPAIQVIDAHRFKQQEAEAEKEQKRSQFRVIEGGKE